VWEEATGPDRVHWRHAHLCQPCRADQGADHKEPAAIPPPCCERQCHEQAYRENHH